MQYLSNLANDLHAIAKKKGFWSKVYKHSESAPIQDIDFMLAKLALVHSEVSEVLEAMRKQQGEEKIVEELGLKVCLHFGAKSIAPFEPEELVADSSRAQRDLKWRPTHRLAHAVWQLARESFPQLDLQEPKENIE
jgi:GDP-D-mannose dehydratase